MCHLVITKSIHCDNSAHSQSRRVACSKMWGQSWYWIARCKNGRTMQDEHAKECQYCGWEMVDEVRPVAEPWQWPTPEEKAEDSNEVMDEDGDVALKECYDELFKYETPKHIPLSSVVVA